MEPLAGYNVGQDIRINDFFILNDTAWFACGGIRDERGFIFRSSDHGSSWHTFDVGFPKSVYSIGFVDAMHGFAGGDFLYMWETFDAGKTWSLYWLDQQEPFNAEDRPGIHDFYFGNDSTWYFCGGENLGEGIIYRTNDNGKHWNFHFEQHEFRSMDFFDAEHGVVAGHGAVALFDTDPAAAILADFSNDFMTSVVCTNSETALGTSYNGGIYRSTDRGHSWNTIARSNRVFAQRVNWNDLAVAGNHLIAVGNNGMTAESTDGGSNWSYAQLGDEPHLYSVYMRGEGVFATSDKGNIFRLK